MSIKYETETGGSIYSKELTADLGTEDEISELVTETLESFLREQKNTPTGRENASVVEASVTNLNKDGDRYIVSFGSKTIEELDKEGILDSVEEARA